MSTFKKKHLEELVGGDMNAMGNDRNPTNDSEIETGPVAKDFKDESNYEKGISTDSDTVFGRYRQNIPWFAVYSFGGTRQGVGTSYNVGMAENTNILKKKTVEEKIEDLVKKSKSNDVTEKGYNPTVSKLISKIEDEELTDNQLEQLKKAIENRINNPKKSNKL